MADVRRATLQDRSSKMTLISSMPLDDRNPTLEISKIESSIDTEDL